MVLSWILAAALVIAVAGALYAVQYARAQRAKVEALAREQRATEDTLERFAATTLPAVADSIRRFESQVPPVEVQAGMENSRLAQILRWISERYADDLSLMRSETRDLTNNEAQQAIKAAEEAARNEVAAASRQATSAAVRSFGTSVVSLGADVSQVVSAALREHRDDAVYETLTRIDHTVQQMIRQAQSYVIVCGGLPGRRWPAQTLTDVVGGAIGRVREYLRVRPNQLDRVVISRAVEPLVHTLATLLDNALRYSPPTSYVDVNFQEGHHGVTVIIDDAGVRMNAEQMEEARQVLAHERPVDIHQLGPSPKVGFPGIAALARRYGFTVYIDGPNVYGGMRAMVYIPESLLVAPQNVQEVAPVTEAKPEPVTVPAQDAPSEQPGENEPSLSVSEITSGGLPKRRRRTVALAPVGPRTEPGLARPEVAAAWHTGSKSGRAAASDDTEGMTS
ncbi:sensor histidine kinase [Nocardia implantans]|uniref:histidine kinase n=1 Tax=Nocardia implantans TaxID=3108168 RepID=A0ABU6AZ72_9NOCA|nr:MULTISPECIES: sensor histidine kinase [unclassified Nocardia]MEA3529818.1 sensor histidine kinase [Nocardia sp. CDC192]MEB3512704.1 sensor histidine kinase [Nocardia sp. CDC186]